MAQTDISTLRKDKGAPKTIGEVLASYKSKFEQILPQHLTAERLLRLAMTSIRENPRLRQADPMSLVGALMRAAKLGLEPGMDAHLVPFRNNKLNIIEVQMIPDYRGLIALCRRSGQIGRFEAHVVYEGDPFDYQMGTDSYLHHKRAGKSSRAVAVWALAESVDKSWCQFEVMDKAQVEAIKDRSRASKDGPWVTDPDEMWKKTVARRLVKYLPRSVEVAQAVRLDDLAESGQSQDNRSVIDVDFSVADIEDAAVQKGNGANEPGQGTAGPPEPPPPEPPSAGAQAPKAEKPKRGRGRPPKAASAPPQEPDHPVPPIPGTTEAPEPAKEPDPEPEPPATPAISDKAQRELDQFTKMVETAEGPEDRDFLETVAAGLSPEVADQAQALLTQHLGEAK